MYALLDIGGKQYKAEQGSVLKIDRLKNDRGDRIEFDTVLLLSDEEEVKIGSPYLAGIKVKAIVEDHRRGGKLEVYKYKRRKGYRRKRGHRQDYTLIKVEEIAGLAGKTGGEE